MIEEEKEDVYSDVSNLITIQTLQLVQDMLQSFK